MWINLTKKSGEDPDEDAEEEDHEEEADEPEPETGPPLLTPLSEDASQLSYTPHRISLVQFTAVTYCM